MIHLLLFSLVVGSKVDKGGTRQDLRAVLARHSWGIIWLRGHPPESSHHVLVFHGKSWYPCLEK